jgi:hypothetical protein
METSSIRTAFAALRGNSLYHLELLLVLILMLVVQSFLNPETMVQRTVFNLLLLAVVLAAIRSLSESRKRLSTAIVVGMVSYAFSWFVEFTESTALIASMLIGYIVVFAILLIALSEDVFSVGPVDANRIIGASCIYFVLGLLWALIYSLLETMNPGSFGFVNRPAGDTLIQEKVSDLMYFSNVTLTTLGYGDITPLSQPAKMFATLQAIVGQLYVAIVIGRMVGLHISESR